MISSLHTVAALRMAPTSVVKERVPGTCRSGISLLFKELEQERRSICKTWPYNLTLRSEERILAPFLKSELGTELIPKISDSCQHCIKYGCYMINVVTVTAGASTLQQTLLFPLFQF